MGTSRQKEISLVLPIKIYLQYLNLGSFIYLSIAEIFFSSPTPRYVGNYLMCFHS